MPDFKGLLKGQPAIFCLSGSSFQALCMIEAIHAFEITDYRVLLCLSENEIPRKGQIITLLEKHNIAYEIESVNFTITKTERFKALLPNRNKYKVAFIGDCNNELLIFKAFRYVSDGGTLVYLDDGIATIKFFNGMYQLNNKLRLYYDLLSKIRRINFDKFFYTVYEGLFDGRHVCINNNFDFFASQQHKKKSVSCIYIIGSNIKGYCAEMRISPTQFMSILRSIILELKMHFSQESIVLVPHGRETMLKELKAMCQEEKIELRMSKISVEMMLLEEKDYPKAVYGFTSSALYNIKKLFPDTNNYNITLAGNSPRTNGHEITSQYYTKFGIERRIVNLERINK